jgi:hypothetical protein
MARGDAALWLYGLDPTAHSAVLDVDAVLAGGTVPAATAEALGVAYGVSFRAGAVAWLPTGWGDRISWAEWPFRHLRIGIPDPCDWVLTKLGRWRGRDPADALAVARTLDPGRLAERVREAGPDYIGDPRCLRWAWEDLADALELPPSLQQLE